MPKNKFKILTLNNHDARLTAHADTFLLRLPRDILNEVNTYLDAKDQIHLQISCVSFFNRYHAIVNKANSESMKNLLQTVISNDIKSIQEILNVGQAYLLSYDPQKLGVTEVENNLTWQKFKAKNPFIHAVVSNQPKTIKVLLDYLKNLKGGPALAKKLWDFSNKIRVQQEKNSRNFNFKKITNAILKEKFPANHRITSTYKLSPSLENTFEKFRKKLSPKEVTALSKHYDILELLMNAYKTYLQLYKNMSERRLSVFAIKVIGSVQNLLTEEDMQSLYKTEKTKKNPYYIPENLTREKLGFENLVIQNGCKAKLESIQSAEISFSNIEKLRDRKTAELKKLRENLSEQQTQFQHHP